MARRLSASDNTYLSFETERRSGVFSLPKVPLEIQRLAADTAPGA